MSGLLAQNKRRSVWIGDDLERHSLALLLTNSRGHGKKRKRPPFHASQDDTDCPQGVAQNGGCFFASVDESRS